ncbi:MAG: phosphoenolpyruvate synthase [Candidatus Levybacteria bacterium]|nr:phosphoenolpyruvate synthase [Candidatus Levybacteria bacterium]
MLQRNVVWFKDVDKEDIALVGGKGANLGEMTRSGFPVPPGFIVTSRAFFTFLKENNLERKIKNLLNTLNLEDSHSLKQVSDLIKKEIISGHMSEELKKEIYLSYKALGGILNEPLVAVRSSATAEDLPNASFAGQQETYLNVKGESNLIIKIKQCWASLFEERAIFYRHENNYDHFRVGIAVPVQKMIESEKSGVMFTINPVTNDKTRITIEAVYGLGEMIVQGKVRPDHYEVGKSSDKITLKEISLQNKMLKKIGDTNREVGVPLLSRKRQKISDREILELADLGKKLEKHYFFPQDAEWAIEKGNVYIVQTRPITTINDKSKIKSQKKDEDIQKASFGKLLLKGDGASPGISTGHVRILKDASQNNTLLSGDVLVAAQTNPDFVPAMKKACAIVTDSGGRTSHAAIVSRELGIPAVVGTVSATKTLENGMVVTVNGETGEIFQGGEVKYFLKSEGIDPDEYIETATQVYLNLAQPDLAEKAAQKKSDGVGLLRAEFIMADIGKHPKKMIRDKKKKEFIEELAANLEKFCSSFNPRPVVYRASDFKTNEYRNLIGGKEFEPIEPNPMLGYRGAFRYIHDPQVFEMELEAIKLVRNKKGFKNLWLMIPYVRTPRELQEVKKIISNSGLTRSSTFKLWMMVEIPSNVILLEKFIEVGIDGVSIGTNDLTMLILGTDRDNSEVSHEFDERDEAVLWAIEHVIKTAAKHDVTSSICGQAASYPEILDVAISSGVTSVSVSPDLVGPVRKLISEKEERIFANKKG